MTNRFRIECEWLSYEYGDATDRATLAEIGIHADEHCATELKDFVARSIRQRARLSAHRLAQWLAANWWRLRWEPEPTRRSHSWRMCHNVGASGGGFVWPDVEFCSDGSDIVVRSRPTSRCDTQQIQYMSGFDASIPVQDFENAIDDFINAVVARLHEERVNETTLEDLWREVVAERRDPELSFWRKLEALMGFDPDEAEEELVAALLSQARKVGVGAVEEVAASSRDRAASDLQELMGPAKDKAVAISVDRTAEIRQRFSRNTERASLPWQRASEAAAIVREEWNLDPGPVSNRRLSEIFQVSESLVTEPDQIAGPMPAGFRGDESSETISVFLKKGHPTGRRFALARLVADHVISQSSERLLPATEAKTDRQKFQRAFAQELLCPFDLLSEFLYERGLTDDDIEDAAEHFDVSPLLVKTTLVNKHVLDRGALAD